MFALKMAMLVIIFIVLSVSQVFAYEVPKLHIDKIKSIGFRVSIPDEDGVELFGFHANINRQFVGREQGDIFMNIVNKNHGRWIFQNTSLKLQKGDTVYYWLHVIKDGIGYYYDDGKFVYNGVSGQKKQHNFQFDHQRQRRDVGMVNDLVNVEGATVASEEAKLNTELRSNFPGSYGSYESYSYPHRGYGNGQHNHNTNSHPGTGHYGHGHQGPGHHYGHQNHPNYEYNHHRPSSEYPHHHGHNCNNHQHNHYNHGYHSHEHGNHQCHDHNHSGHGHNSYEQGNHGYPRRGYGNNYYGNQNHNHNNHGPGYFNHGHGLNQNHGTYDRNHGHDYNTQWYPSMGSQGNGYGYNRNGSGNDSNGSGGDDEFDNSENPGNDDTVIDSGETTTLPLLPVTFAPVTTYTSNPTIESTDPQIDIRLGGVRK